MENKTYTFVNLEVRWVERGLVEQPMLVVKADSPQEAIDVKDLLVARPRDWTIIATIA